MAHASAGQRRDQECKTYRSHHQHGRHKIDGCKYERNGRRQQTASDRIGRNRSGRSKGIVDPATTVMNCNRLTLNDYCWLSVDWLYINSWLWVKNCLMCWWSIDCGCWRPSSMNYIRCADWWSNNRNHNLLRSWTLDIAAL